MSSKLPPSASSKSLLDVLDSPTRLQELFASFSSRNGSRNGSQDDDGDGDDAESPAAFALLEKRLLLSAQLGLALLEKQEQLMNENRGLHSKQKELETSVSQLLDRLAQSYKENAQLIKRAERANANLEASEASNRQLLITLEEDRKAARRLNARHEKQHAATITAAGRGDSSEEAAARAAELEELRQELKSERRRANVADSKARQALSKLADNEQNLEQVSQQLDRATSSETKRNHERKGSHSISASRNRSRPSSISMPTSPFFHNGEQTEFVQVIDLLKHENETMRNDLQELHSLLDKSRDQIAHLQAERSERGAFSPYEDGLNADTSIATTSASEPLRSPANSSEPSTSTAATSQAVHDWMPMSAYQTSSIMGRLPHTSNDSSGSSAHASSRGHVRRRSVARQLPPTAGRRSSARAMSVDLTNLISRRGEDNENDPYFRSPSPSLRGTSPILRPFALGASVNSIASSMGSPALETAHEDARESDDHASEGPTILEIGPSPSRPLQEGESGISMSSPTKRGLRIHQDSSSTLNSSSKKRDAAVQTADMPNDQHYHTSSPAAKRTERPQYTQYTSSIMSSDLASEFERSESVPQSHSSGPDYQRGNRTLALGTLMEHVVKLVTRLKGADIISLEQRLKRQNLPGDVSHLAKNTLRDILQEVDGMRNHFRQVLEQEAAALASEGAHHGADLSNESLMARKDFVTVVKLFRDVLYELGRLRLIINRITLEPQLASRLRELETTQTPTDIMAATLPLSADKSGPAALLAPLSRLFYGTDGQSTPPSQNARAAAVSRVKPASRATASSALAAATVNVEFGGQGGIRRQVSIMPQAGDGGLAGKYNSLGRGSASNSKPATRRDLSSIFAGGAGATTTARADPWVMLPRNPTQRQVMPSGAPSTRQRAYQPYSKAVDAVVDSVAEEDDFRPNLLERTLRPRGLSDSSIHSTYMSHANPSGRLLSPAGLALSAATDAASPGEAMFAQGDGTVKASLASSSSRRSILRAISGTGRIAARNTPSPHDSPAQVHKDSPSRPDLPASASNNLLSPTKAITKARNIEGAESESGSDREIGLSKSPAGPAGLFANIGAWAARAGGGLASSYVEAPTLAGSAAAGERRPAIRSTSTSAARKHVHREMDL